MVLSCNKKNIWIKERSNFKKQCRFLLAQLSSLFYKKKQINKQTNKQANQLELHKKEKCENQYFCNIAMPSEDSNILELINTKNLTKHQFYLCNCLIEKIDGYKNHPESSFKVKVGKYSIRLSNIYNITI